MRDGNNIDDWTDLEWESLIYSIRTRQCILLLGPDAAVTDTADQEYLHSKFIHKEDILKRCEEKSYSLSSLLGISLSQNFFSKEVYKNINLANLTQAASYNRFERESTKSQLRAKAANFYTTTRERKCTSDLHRKLAQLPFEIVITSTPDEMMYQGFLETEEKNPIIDRYHFNGKNSEILKAWSTDTPLIYYLFGNIDERESLVLTENDLLNYVVNIINNAPPLPVNLLSELRQPEKSLLFIGFGLRHWYLRILLHALLEKPVSGQKNEKEKESDSFALEDITDRNYDSYRRAILFFKKSAFNLHFCNIDRANFVELLISRVSPFLGQPAEQKNSIFKIFISAVNEDDTEALKLKSFLESNKIEAWYFREDQKTGADWKNEIEIRILDADYFIFMQSTNLVRKGATDCYRELNLAKEKLKTFPSTWHFIFPVKISNMEDVPELDMLASVDLTDYSNINKLLKDLNDDWDTRKNKSEC